MLLHRATLILCAVSAAGLSDDSADFYAQAAADNSDSATADNSTATATFLTEYVESTGARCLDGSPAVYYWRPGTGDGAKKWYLHQQGGGWCETWDDCLGRSKTGLGTSKGYPKTTNLKGGYFDPTPAVNPMMFNWNQVFVRYCDGGSFSGDNETVTTYKGTPLYYRGKRIREAVFDSLIKKHALAQASDLVVSGCSAGGLATFLHTDQYCDALRAVAPGLKCAGLPDSGFFLDYQDPRRHAATVASSPAHPPLPLGTTVSGNYHKGLKWVFTQMNATSGINQDCIAAMRTGGVPTDAPLYLCMFAEHTSPFTHTPLFPMQSTYDSWQSACPAPPDHRHCASERRSIMLSDARAVAWHGPWRSALPACAIPSLCPCRRLCATRARALFWCLCVQPARSWPRPLLSKHGSGRAGAR